jgi:hypothetical protein
MAGPGVAGVLHLTGRVGESLLRLVWLKHEEEFAWGRRSRNN